MQVVCPGSPWTPTEEETKKKKAESERLTSDIPRRKDKESREKCKKTDACNGVSKVLMLVSKPARKTNLKMFQGPRINSVMQEINLEAEGPVCLLSRSPLQR